MALAEEGKAGPVGAEAQAGRRQGKEGDSQVTVPRGWPVAAGSDKALKGASAKCGAQSEGVEAAMVA